jgi:hypothetical protein
VDLTIAIACMAMGIALPVLIVALVGRRARRQLVTAGAYREVAHLLGLMADTRGVSVRGVRDGRPLWLGEVQVGHGPERRTEMHGVIGLRRPLGLGVRVRKRRGRRETGIPLGGVELDKRLVAEAAWPEGLHALLDAGGREQLDRLVALSPDLDLDDERLRIRLARAPSKVGELGAIVEALEGAAIGLEAARGAGPPTPGSDWAAGWGTLRDRGFLLAPEMPSLTGTAAGWPVEIVPTWVGGTWLAWVAVHFDPDEDSGLLVVPQRAPAQDIRDGQDIRIGDPEFDDAFVVKGYDPGAVRTRLGPEVQAPLLRLRREGRVSLDDYRLVVAGVSPEVEVLVRVLDLVEDLAALVGPSLPPARDFVDVEAG